GHRRGCRPEVVWTLLRGQVEQLLAGRREDKPQSLSAATAAHPEQYAQPDRTDRCDAAEIDENHWRVAGRRSVKRIFELRRTQEVQLTGRGDAVGVTATLAL
ncbi:MAG: hypothetical protein ABSH27_13635, partial [Solirubrobacteraceae bacterium]